MPRAGQGKVDAMLTIGEFSKATGLTVKALRLYHEEGLLVPSFVDPQTGYRHYDDRQVEAARVIAYLRALEFPLAEIKELLRHQEDDEGLLDAVERHKAAIEQKLRRLRKVARSLEQFISQERQAKAMSQGTYEVQEKVLDPVLIGGVRMKGRYSDCGKGFKQIGRAMGRYICGKPFLLLTTRSTRRRTPTSRRAFRSARRRPSTACRSGSSPAAGACHCCTRVRTSNWVTRTRRSSST